MCPQCRQPMLVFELDGVEIDRCLSCRGTWLDAGELEQIARLEGGSPERLGLALRDSAPGKRGRRRCPRCRRRLRITTVGEKPAVELDRCPLGHGFWFDAGEMETLIRAFAEGDGGPVGRFLSELYRTELQSIQGG